ncbi:MAG: hypothetical protein C0606_08705 [Hyphomicrobiales bacterium]|nr:MAG: hypothetical protein C0606_08705 [Hyphomicrobiales bacterium]
MRIVRFILLMIAVLMLAGGAYALWPEPALPEGVRADRIVVEKSARRLTLMHGGTSLKNYRVSLGGAPAGPKERQGDERTPEGSYRIDWRNAASKFHRALHVSYPDAKDRQNARRLGASPGGHIMIHGIANGYGWIGRFHRFYDWTNGCIAVTDAEIEEIWRAVPDGTPIEIVP